MSLLSPPLIAFLAVAKYKSVHAAASDIHITQTAVTQRIRVLENQLKTTLFIRSRKGMTLTQEGEALLHYCKSVQQLEGHTIAKIKGDATLSFIRMTISGPSSIMHARVIPAFIAIAKKFPQLLYYFDVNDIEDRHKALQRGLCDFAILQPEDASKEMHYKILRPEQYVLVAPYAWQKRKLKDILSHEKMIDFDPLDQMTINYLKHFKLDEFAQSERHFVNRTESMAQMIASGLGYGLLTTEFSESYIKSKKLILLNQAKIFENKMVLAWFNRPEPPAYFSAIIDSLE